MIPTKHHSAIPTFFNQSLAQTRTCADEICQERHGQECRAEFSEGLAVHESILLLRRGHVDDETRDTGLPQPKEHR